MMRKLKAIHILTITAVVLLAITTLFGVFSWNISKSFDAVNQYGETIKMWGSGIYARDSYFKAPIFIGSDLTVLLKKYEPDVASVEKLFFFKNQKTIITVAQGRGVILATLAKFGVKIFEYTPLQIKMSITCVGVVLCDKPLLRRYL